MREIRQSGSEGGVAHTRHSYPYHYSHFALNGFTGMMAEQVERGQGSRPSAPYAPDFALNGLPIDGKDSMGTEQGWMRKGITLLYRRIHILSFGASEDQREARYE